MTGDAVGNHRRAGLLPLGIILLLTVVMWVALRGPGSDPDGLNYALNMEAGDPARAFPSDHLLWHGIVWCLWALARLFDPLIRPVPIQQFLNLILVGSSIALLFHYLKARRNQWWAGLGVLASFGILKAMAGEDVDAGPVLATTVFLFLLPASAQKPGNLATIVLLAAMPLLNKSLFLLYPGYVIAHLLFSNEEFKTRLIRSLSIGVAACLLSLAGFWLVWLGVQNGKIPFTAWMASYAAKSSGFWAGSLREVVIGIPIVIGRIFVSLTPYKAYQTGSFIGLIGIVLSGMAVLCLLWLVVKSLTRNKAIQKEANNHHEVMGMLVGIAPMLLFFCLWTPGYYTYWSRFLPVLWLILALRMPLRGWTKMAACALPVLLLVVNDPSLWQAKEGEEAGRLTHWLDDTVQAGDLVVLGGEGVLFDGKMLTYHLGADVVMLDYVGKLDSGEEFLRFCLQEAMGRGGHIWLVADRGRFSANRIISGESDAINKGRAILAKVCAIGEKKRMNDLGFEDAGIASCQPR